MKILIVNGVNINMTGRREPVYGNRTLDEINADLCDFAEAFGAELEFFTSNIEGEIVDRLQRGGFDALVINAGAYSHYSHAIADALAYVDMPKVEVHMTNIFAREGFRRESVTAEKCDGCITGLGEDVYFTAVWYLTQRGAK